MYRLMDIMQHNQMSLTEDNVALVHQLTNHYRYSIRGDIYEIYNSLHRKICVDKVALLQQNLYIRVSLSAEELYILNRLLQRGYEEMRISDTEDTIYLFDIVDQTYQALVDTMEVTHTSLRMDLSTDIFID